MLPAQAYFTLALSFDESGPRGAGIEQECHEEGLYTAPGRTSRNFVEKFSTTYLRPLRACDARALSLSV